MAPSPTPADEKFRRAVALHQAGRIAEAQAQYDEILRQAPQHVDALHMAGIADIQTGDFASALSHLDRALGIAPGFALAHHNRGVALERLGRPADAVASYDAALRLEPGHVDAWFNRGNALCALERFDNAVASYDRAIRLAPNHAEAHYNRGGALRDAGRLQAALASYEQAIRLQPALAAAHGDRAALLMRLGRWEAALEALDRLLGLDARNAPALADRGAALQKLNRPAEAVASYERAAALQPMHAEALHALGVALSGLNRFKALACYDRALAVRPDYPEALNARGNVLRELLRPAEALAAYDRAVALKPDYAEAHENRGLVLAELDQLDESVAALETAVQLSPRRARVYYSLSGSKTFAAGDPAIAAMAALVDTLPDHDGEGRMHLHFALGKALEDVGEPASAFRHFIAGNAIKRAGTPYDEAAALALLERTRIAFTPAAMEARGGEGDPSARPVFIVGMPRCGSTLVEQILASHPQVHGAGEAVDFAQALARFGDGPEAPLNAPEAAAALDRASLRALGSDYARRIAAGAPQAAVRVTDKFLENFRHVGLIHMALPNARIIHVRRELLDTCVSGFTKLFTGGAPYTYDLRELGRYYRAYERLMQHWRGALPPDVMLEVQYEDLVRDLEAQSRRLVAYCGLRWDPACLDFHRSERRVRTASMLQVRRPIFTGSVGRWAAVRPFLDPLIDGLGARADSAPPERPS